MDPKKRPAAESTASLEVASYHYPGRVDSNTDDVTVAIHIRSDVVFYSDAANGQLLDDLLESALASEVLDFFRKLYSAPLSSAASAGHPMQDVDWEHWEGRLRRLRADGRNTSTLQGVIDVDPDAPAHWESMDPQDYLDSQYPHTDPTIMVDDSQDGPTQAETAMEIATQVQADEATQIVEATQVQADETAIEAEGPSSFQDRLGQSTVLVLIHAPRAGPVLKMKGSGIKNQAEFMH